MSQVPAATRALRVLRFLASQPDPVALDRIMRACDLPRSTAYHLLNAMIDEGFVVHLPEEHRYGLGVGRLRGRQRLLPPGTAPAHRPPRRWPPSSTARGRARTWPCCTVATCCTSSRSGPRAARPWSPTSGVRLPAHLTASGKAILAALPAAQVRALYPDREAFVDRHGGGPRLAARAAHACSPRPDSAGTRPRTARSPRDWPASPRRCWTTTRIPSPGSRSPSPATRASGVGWPARYAGPPTR